MDRIGTWAGAVVVAVVATTSTGQGQTLTNAEIRREIALLKEDLTALPGAPAPRRVIMDIRASMVAVMRRSTDSYLTVLRRAFASRRNVLGGTTTIFTYARRVVGWWPWGEALLGALFRPDAGRGARGVATDPADVLRIRRFAARRFTEAGADPTRMRRILRRLETLPTPIRQGNSVSPDT